jgi:hypothetical protein
VVAERPSPSPLNAAGLPPRKGRLELAGPQLQGRKRPQVDVGVLQHRRPAAEVRHHPEVHPAENGTLHDRPGASQDEGVGSGPRGIVQEEAAVHLRVAAEPHLEGAIRRPQAEPIRSGTR